MCYNTDVREKKSKGADCGKVRLVKMKKYPIEKILFLLLVCLGITALVKAYNSSQVEMIERLEQNVLSEEDWEITMPDRGGKEYSRRVPEELKGELVLAVSGYHSMVKVLAEGKEIYFSEDPYRENGIFWSFIRLPDTIRGQTLTLQFFGYEDGTVRGINPRIYLGEHNVVFLRILQENIMETLIGTIITLVGVSVCVTGILIRKRVNAATRKGLLALGNFIFLTGIWMITDSRILQFVTGRAALITLVSFLSFMLMPYFILIFIGEMMIYKKKSIMLFGRLYLLNAAVCLFCYIFRILPLYKTLLSVHILIVVSIGLIVKNGILEIRNFKNKEMKKIMMGMLLMIAFGIAALICFYVNNSLNYSLLYGAGIALFILCLLGAAADRLRYYFITSASAEEYQKIAHIDNMTRMGNRMAFAKQQAGSRWQENKSCIIMDINNLKAANDKYGHREGDSLIIDAAECIQTAFGGIGKCYRIGGDEFAVLLDTSSEETILWGIEKMQQQAELKSNGRRVPVEIAYGYAIQGENITSFEELFHAADTKMYERKHKMKKN